MFKVGDRVVISNKGKMQCSNSKYNPLDQEGTVYEVNGGLKGVSISVDWGGGYNNCYNPDQLMLVIDKTPPVPDGGPQEYYDLPSNTATLNDLIEYKSDKHWLGDSFHLSNILKASWRWGIKSGTSKEYDARKFIYSGARLLKKYAGVQAVRDTLQRMLDDPQFKE
jgi:hypothetical protein